MSTTLTSHYNISSTNVNSQVSRISTGLIDRLDKRASLGGRWRVFPGRQFRIVWDRDPINRIPAQDVSLQVGRRSWHSFVRACTRDPWLMLVNQERSIALLRLWLRFEGFTQSAISHGPCLNPFLCQLVALTPVLHFLPWRKTKCDAVTACQDSFR